MMRISVLAHNDLCSSLASKNCEDLDNIKFSIHPNWLQIINITFGHDSYLIIDKKNNKIIGYLPSFVLLSRLFG